MLRFAADSANRRQPACQKDDAVDPSPQQSRALKLPLKNPRIVVIKSKRGWNFIRMARWFALTKLAWDSIRFRTKCARVIARRPKVSSTSSPKTTRALFTCRSASVIRTLKMPSAACATSLISRAQHDAIVRAIKRKATPPQNTALGGDIYIHGNGASSDWTWGCVALENEDIKELFDAVPVGTPVTIKP